MIVVDQKSDLRSGPGPIRRRWPRIFRGLLFLAYTTLIFAIGGGAERTHFFSTIVKPFVAGNLEMPLNYLNGLSSRPRRLTIDMKFEAFTELAAKRERDLHRLLDVLRLAKSEDLRQDIRDYFQLDG